MGNWSITWGRNWSILYRLIVQSSHTGPCPLDGAKGYGLSKGYGFFSKGTSLTGVLRHPTTVHVRWGEETHHQTYCIGCCRHCSGHAVPC